MTDEATFLDLSAELTGFALFDLIATGLTELYFTTAVADIGPETWRRLFDAWHDIARDLPPADRPAAIADRIMAVPALADAAQRIIALWYVGSWYSVLPGGSQVVSATAYVEGLMWKAIGSHPMGAKPQGYAAWATNPPLPAAGENR